MELNKAISKLFGVQLLSRVISFVGLALFARQLGASKVGIFFLFLSIVRIVTTISNMGLRGALEKRMSEKNNTQEYISETVILKGITLFASSLLIFIFRRQIDSYLRMELTVFIILAISSEEIYQVALHILRGELRVNRAADLRFVRQTSWIFIGLVLIYYFSLDVRGLIYAWILGAAIAFLVGLYVQSSSLSKPSASRMKSLIQYGKYDVVSDAGSTLYNWFDVIIIGLILTQAEVGAYETAWRLSAVAVILGVAIRETIFPQISAWSSRNNTERIEDLLTEMVTASMFFVIPSFVGTLILSDELLMLIFGQEFTVASTALVILMGQKLFISINQITGRTLQAIDRPDFAAYAMIMGVSLNLVLNPVLIIFLGLEGAAIATGISTVLMTIVQVSYLNKNLVVSFDWKSIGWCVFSALLMGGVIQMLQFVHRVDQLYELIGFVVGGAIVYFLIVVISPTLRIKIINQINNVNLGK